MGEIIRNMGGVGDIHAPKLIDNLQELIGLYQREVHHC